MIPCKKYHIFMSENIVKKGTLSGLNEDLSKMMKNVFYFTLKALFVLKIFKFFS